MGNLNQKQFFLKISFEGVMRSRAMISFINNKPDELIICSLDIE